MNVEKQGRSVADFAQRVRIKQQKLAADLKPHYDFIVCGAGTSGSVVAARLAADRTTQVLVLEAGGTDETDLVANPTNWPMTLGSELDWRFVAEPNPHLNGRAIPYSMGKVLGGGSSINVSTWSPRTSRRLGLLRGRGGRCRVELSGCARPLPWAYRGLGRAS